ncbi:hypothetical protein BH23BAC1_BH23BAC1_21100 [soil metagenome]
MINQIFKKTKYTFKASIEQIINKKYWNSIPAIEMDEKLNFGINGGSKLIVEDLNNDGCNEFIWIQTAGIFKSKIYEKSSEIKIYKNNIGQEDVFCITSTDEKGIIQWQIGKPWEGDKPYLCHGHEQIIVTADVNGDGFQELLTFDAGNKLLIINFKGEIIKEIILPNDNFSIVYFVKTGSGKNDFILVIGTMDIGYSPHPYANPWLILDNNFEIISCKDYLGAGHNIVIDDINGDGIPELLIGYQLVNIKGQIIWTLDYWKDKEIDSLEQHIDCVQSHWVDGEWFATISGSDKQYYLNAKGEALWVKTLPHPQYNLIGKYNGELRIFVANQREIMNSFSIDGIEKWNGLLPEHWPSGKPVLINEKRPIHINEPLYLIPNSNSYSDDYFIYTEGGWPFIANFNGRVKLRFQWPSEHSQFKFTNQFRRINDIGESFDVVIDNQNNIHIYNRWNVWTYNLTVLK